MTKATYASNCHNLFNNTIDKTSTEDIFKRNAARQQASRARIASPNEDTDTGICPRRNKTTAPKTILSRR